MRLKDKARAKAERRAARRAEPRTGSGPPIEPNDPIDAPAADIDTSAVAAGTAPPGRPR